jgi:hypothetical protein
VKREAALTGGFLDRGMLLEHFDGLLDVEFCDAGGARVVAGELVELGFVFSPEFADGVEPCLNIISS